MFKSWSKKNKIRAVFKLQFMVTQVPKLKKPALMISLVPEDVGKPTVRLEKVAVEDGTCTWEKPVYEPMKLIRESKTEKINEKLYHFIVSTGLKKSGYLGEASIDFADFAAETEPLTMSLPLQFANSGAVLHITIQRMQDADDQRDVEENGAPRLPSENSFDESENKWDIDGNINFTEDQDLTGYLNKNKGNGDYGKTTSANRNGMVDTSMTNNKMHHRSNTDWSADYISDISLGDSPSSVEDNNRKENLLEASGDSIDKLKNEIALWMRQAELSELELQSLRKQIAKEIKQGQNLSRQIINLQEERDELELECERLKSLQKSTDEAEAPKRLQAEVKDTRGQLEAIRQELNHEKTLRSNLQLQLHKSQDSNSELILVVKDLESMLELKNQEMCDLSRKMDLYKKEQEEQSMHIKQLALLKKDNNDMSLKLKQYQEDQEAIMENERSGYIEIIENLESQVERLEETIKKQAHDFSESFISSNELENQVKTFEKQLEKQAKEFEDNLDAITCAKAEQEKRAIQAEDALRKMSLNEAARTERLQEELKRLSLEMTSKVEEKEKQSKEADELCKQNRNLEEKLKEVNKELGVIKKQEKMKVQELIKKMDLKAKQIEQMSLELENKSQQFECIKEHEKENNEAFLSEIQMLKEEIERLKKDKSHFVKIEAEKEKLTDELRKMKALIHEKEKQIQSLNKEKEKLVKKSSLAKHDIEAAMKINSIHATDPGNFSNLLTEVASLKEKNKCMENELKEMQGRYSEISLRFAEVEGERQQLVMTVRNLRIGKN